MNNIYGKKNELRDYYLALDKKQRNQFAGQVGTTTGHLHQIYHGYSKCNEAVAIEIDKFTKGKIKCDDLCPDVDFAYLRKLCKPAKA